MLHKKNNLVSNNLEIGLDEAGRGPLIGRVYAGAVVWPNMRQASHERDDVSTLVEQSSNKSHKDQKSKTQFLIHDVSTQVSNQNKNSSVNSLLLHNSTHNNFTLNELKYIKDSKKLSTVKRENALKWIQTNIPYWGVGYADEKEIDTINILNATKLAMDRAIINLKNKLNNNLIITNLIIDGTGWDNKFSPYIVDSIIKGDNLYYSIAAASIIAKTYHDKYINDLCKLDPLLDTYYFLSKNMGYPTKDHRNGLIKYGPSIYHRTSFNGVKKL